MLAPVEVVAVGAREVDAALRFDDARPETAQFSGPVAGRLLGLKHVPGQQLALAENWTRAIIYCHGPYNRSTQRVIGGGFVDHELAAGLRHGQARPSCHVRPLTVVVVINGHGGIPATGPHAAASSQRRAFGLPFSKCQRYT